MLRRHCDEKYFYYDMNPDRMFMTKNHEINRYISPVILGIIWDGMGQDISSIGAVYGFTIVLTDGKEREDGS